MRFFFSLYKGGIPETRKSASTINETAIQLRGIAPASYRGPPVTRGTAPSDKTHLPRHTRHVNNFFRGRSATKKQCAKKFCGQWPGCFVPGGCVQRSSYWCLGLGDMPRASAVKWHGSRLPCPLRRRGWDGAPRPCAVVCWAWGVVCWAARERRMHHAAPCPRDHGPWRPRNRRRCTRGGRDQGAGGLTPAARKPLPHVPWRRIGTRSS